MTPQYGTAEVVVHHLLGCPKTCKQNSRVGNANTKMLLNCRQLRRPFSRESTTRKLEEASAAAYLSNFNQSQTAETVIMSAASVQASIETLLIDVSTLVFGSPQPVQDFLSPQRVAARTRTYVYTATCIIPSKNNNVFCHLMQAFQTLCIYSCATFDVHSWSGMILLFLLCSLNHHSSFLFLCCVIPHQAFCGKAFVLDTPTVQWMTQD